MPAKQAVTISDVARQAGLSVATVSRALNRSPKLDPQTAKRVFEAVEQLGYNAAPITGRATERSRMREKCYTVEVILSPQPEQKDMLQLNFFSNVYTGIQSFFLQAGNITTGLVTWDCSWGQISDLPPALTERLKRADAIMLAGDLAVELTLALREFTPNLIAIFSNEMNTLPIDSVANNNFMAGMEAARLLIDNGFPEIGFLASPDRISSHELRLNGAMIQTTRRSGTITSTSAGRRAPTMPTSGRPSRRGCRNRFIHPHSSCRMPGRRACCGKSPPPMACAVPMRSAFSVSTSLKCFRIIFSSPIGTPIHANSASRRRSGSSSGC